MKLCFEASSRRHWHVDCKGQQRRVWVVAPSCVLCTHKRQAGPGVQLPMLCKQTSPAPTRSLDDFPERPAAAGVVYMLAARQLVPGPALVALIHSASLVSASRLQASAMAMRSRHTTRRLHLPRGVAQPLQCPHRRGTRFQGLSRQPVFVSNIVLPARTAAPHSSAAQPLCPSPSPSIDSAGARSLAAIIR